MNQKIITIIPARGGSKGIPDKNIIPVAGKPLITWTIEQSIATKSIEWTYVSTNDYKIAAVAEKSGAKIIWRPEELCTDEATSESAILHALDFLELEEHITPSLVVFLQATSPLRKRDDIEKSISLFNKKKADSLFSGANLEDFLIWEKNNNTWVSKNYDYKNRGRRQKRKPQFVENGSIYIFKPEIIKKYRNRIGGKLELYKMEFWQTWELDTQEDIKLVEFYINTKLKS